MIQRFPQKSASCGLRIEPRAGAGFPAIIGPSRRATRPGRRRGFTLVELLTVMIIIGIILSFVLTAAMDAVRRGEERTTQTLITKLDAGLSDRVEALLQTRPDYGLAHLNIANIFATGMPQSITRAQVIAWYDYVKAEMPDVFVLGTDPNYPLNFAGNPYPTTVNTGLPYPYVLPLGQGDNLNPQLSITGTGVYGASYQAAAGIYKNLGYTATGYDGVDNDGNGMVDDNTEGVSHGPPWTADPVVVAKVTANLQNHKHSTARSEMLYGLLVEGSGPLGSVFSADDFTTKEVQDTDGDGLPEFIDAWGQPIQFFRWPLLYHSDIQRGQVIAQTGALSWTLAGPSGAPYVSVFQTREQNPLDPNQQLMAPTWWFSSLNGSSITGFTGISTGLGVSQSVLAFETYFHRLSEPDPNPNSTTNFGLYWDRSSNTGYGFRRAFYSKFLIVSSGPDQLSGIFRYPDSSPPTAMQLIANENNALPFSAGTRTGMDVVDFTANASIPSANATITNNPSLDPTQPSTSDLIQAAQDDISNQNLSAVGGIGGSG